MRTVDFYIDAAKKKTGVESDIQLSKNIGLSRGAVNNFRTRRAWPADETMKRLAELAGIPPEEALLELNAWRSSGATQQIYKRLIEKLGESLTVLIICFISLTAMSSSAQAAAENINHVQYEKYTLSHKMAQVLKKAITRLSRFLNPLHATYSCMG